MEAGKTESGDTMAGASEERNALIEGLPKAELHIHIEGSLEPEMMLALAARNGQEAPYASVEAARAAYDFGKLQDFLDLYYKGMAALRSEQDFHDLAMAYLEKAAADGVTRVEMFFDPQGHTERGVDFGTVIDGLTGAMREAEQRLGVSSGLILCFLRHLDEDDAQRTLDQALPHRDRLIGVGLDSSEVGHPPSKFERVFRRAREEAGLRVVAHAGEEGPPDYVWQAIDLLGVERIDHGNRALEDDRLVKRIAADGLPLTVCPLSNLRLCVVEDLSSHPLKRMLDAGLKATVNSDDPAYFGGYVNDNYRRVADALALERAELATLMRNSLAAAFAEPAWTATALEDFDSRLAAL